MHSEEDIPEWNCPLDRIVKIETTREEYVSSKTDWIEYFDEIVGVTKYDSPSQSITIEVNEKRIDYIRTKPLHHTMKYREEDGRHLIEINVIPNHELESLILSFGNDLKVIEPQSFFERIESRR
jgi:predicted DNA-binding transcriptional regulator YafY